MEQVIYRKCEPYVRMYPDVPLVGNMCRAVIRILQSGGFKPNAKYDDLCRTNTGYIMRMFEGDYLPGPRNAIECDILEHYVAQELGLSLTALRGVCSDYDSAEAFSDFPCGYVEKDNIFLSCEYEVLVRNLYIPGPQKTKLLDTLPAENIILAAQYLPSDDQAKNETNSTVSSQSTQPPNKSARKRKTEEQIIWSVGPKSTKGFEKQRSKDL